MKSAINTAVNATPRVFFALMFSPFLQVSRYVMLSGSFPGLIGEKLSKGGEA